MRKARFLVPCLAGIVAVTAIALLIAQPAAAATNLIANPGFESGNLSGWSCSSTDSVTASPVHSGSDALAGATTSNDFAQCTQSVSVTPSTNYTLSAFVNGAYVYIGVSGTGTSDTNTWTPSTSGAYAQLSVGFTTGASTTSVTIFVHGWYGQGTYFADDFNLPGTGGEATPTSTSIPPPPTPTSTPGGGGGGGGNSSLPTHLITGYWQDFTNGAMPLKLSQVPMGYTIIAVAFANADPSNPGGVTFSIDSGLSSALGGYTSANFISDIQTLHSQGRKVILSVGGQDGTITVSDSTSATNFANSVFSLMQQYGFDGVDIDLENGINATFMAQALEQLSAKAGPSLIITMAPQTIDMQSTSMAYFQLALNIKSILTIVNMQYYNSGSMNGCDTNLYSEGSVDFLTALACIQLQGGLRPDQVGLGLPASPSAAGSGYISPTIVNNGLDCLTMGTNCGSFKPTTTWPIVRGAMTWSINWDASNGYNWVNTIFPHLASLPGGGGGGNPTPTPTSAPPTPTPTSPPNPTPTPTHAPPTPTPTGAPPPPTPTPTPPAGGNLVSNPGFESGSLSPWTCDAGTAAVVGSPVHSGSHAVQLNPTSSDDAQCTQTVSVQSGHTYTLSAYVQGNYAYIGVSSGGSCSNWIISATYTQLSCSFTASASSVTIFVHGWYGQGSVFADDFSLQ
jgi:chitinase